MDPLIVRWDNAVQIPDDPRDDTLVCCLTEDGRPVALLLDETHRRDLRDQLTSPH